MKEHCAGERVAKETRATVRNGQSRRYEGIGEPAGRGCSRERETYRVSVLK